MYKHEIQDLLKKSSSDEKGILIHLKSEDIFINARFGSGTNLSSENIKNRYDDYITHELLEYSGDPDIFEEVDEGMITFNNKEHQDYYKNMDKIIEAVLEFKQQQEYYRNMDKFIKAVLEFNDYEDSYPIMQEFHE